MMGLAAKSSAKDDFFDYLASTWHSENYLRQLAKAFTLLAKTRLTDKQRSLLFAAHQTLKFRPNLSPTALADHLSRKLQLPLSTTKFNLNVLKNAGLFDTNSSSKHRSRVSLSYGGRLLTQLLPKTDRE
jgi:hypothetical protein